MKIGIDVSNLHSLSQKRGIGFYTQNLVDSLKEFTQEDILLIEGKNSNKINLVHYPFFDFFRHTLPFFKQVNTVITIHDVIPLIFPQHYPAGLRGSLNLILQKISLRDVKAIITDSYSSKDDIVRYLKVDPGKVFPIPLAPTAYFKPIKDKDFLENLREKYKLPNRFALYYGDVNWNKNLLNLAKACLAIGVDLVLIGKGFEQEDLEHFELQSFKQFLEIIKDNPKFHKLGFVSNEDLVGIINLAQVVVLPSFYEGFGLPILESQACGTPVITSNISSMPEVAGNGALLVNPSDVDGISKAIQKINQDEVQKEDLIKKGFKNVSKFSWKKVALETVDVYKKTNF